MILFCKITFAQLNQFAIYQLIISEDLLVYKNQPIV